MRRVIGDYGIDPALAQQLPQAFLVSRRAQRGSDVDEIAELRIIVTIKAQVYRRRFAIDLAPHVSAKGNGGKLFRRGKMQQVKLDAKLPRKRDHLQRRCQ